MIIKGTYHTNHLRLYGHPPFYCDYVADIRLAYIPIPKNMTKIMKMVYEPYNYQRHDRRTLEPNTKIVVILRDPLERWASGVVEFFKIKERLDLLRDQQFVDSVVCNTMCFDIHTVPQTYFLEGADTNRCRFFYISKDVNQHLNFFHKRNYGVDLNIDDINNSEHMDIQENLKNTIRSNPDHQRVFNAFYDNDYEIMGEIRYTYSPIINDIL